MRVAIVTQFPSDPNAPHGGVEAVSVNLTRALAAYSDLDLHVVTMDSRSTTLSVDAWEGVTVHRLPGLKGSVLRNAIGHGRHLISIYVSRLAPDVVHTHDTYGLMAKGLAVPRVFTIHGFIYGDTLVSGARFARLRSWIWRWVETRGWADQPHIISISPYVRERLSGIARGAIHDIDNPIAEDFFDIVRCEERAIVFSAAAVCPRKNTLNLVKVVEQIVAQGGRIELRIAGPVTDPGYGERVQASIVRSGLDHHVKLLGRIDTEQVRAELARAAVFAIVSLEENSPMGIEEAMAAGVPVLTSNRCGMPYMVRHGETGFLVNPHDVTDVVRRLRRLLEDTSLRHAMGIKARAIARDRFHPHEVARRTRKVYLEAIAGSQERLLK
ncbi:MAG: glycosyltransferase family 4 protein [Nitrospirae bacterium]|nr:glycosyltransferase family 4 protein [Nitrospirota bacterium]